jgi:hypothetical protein
MSGEGGHVRVRRFGERKEMWWEGCGVCCFDSKSGGLVGVAGARFRGSSSMWFMPAISVCVIVPRALGKEETRFSSGKRGFWVDPSCAFGCCRR